MHCFRVGAIGLGAALAAAAVISSAPAADPAQPWSTVLAAAPASEDEKKEAAKDDDKPAERGQSDEKSDNGKEGESKSGDAKSSEKPADDKPSAKSDDDAKEESADDKAIKKPADEDLLTVKPAKWKAKIESDGVFVAAETEEVALRPERWSSFKVVEAVAHGARVRKGDVLVKFDDRDYEKAVAEKSLDERLGEITLMAAEEEFPRLEKSADIDLAEAERALVDAEREMERFRKTMREISEKYSAFSLKTNERYLESAQEELRQLEKMYKADELTEETEEIVLKMQQFEVEVASFYVEFAKISHDYTLQVSIPEREIQLQESIEKAQIALERARMEKSLGLSKRRYEMQSLRERRTRAVEAHSKLLTDRALMTLRAPCDGVVYYGRCVNGRWGEVSSLEQKLIPFGVVAPNSVLFTVVSQRPLSVRSSVGEKDLPGLAEGQAATVRPAADAEVAWEAAVERLAPVPQSGNQFSLEVRLREDELPDWLKAGMTCRVQVTVAQKDEAIVLPFDVVQTDDDEGRYVMLQGGEDKDPVRRDLKLGRRQGKNVEIVAGLAAGDVIVKGAKDEPAEDKEGDEDDG